jgi:hypothetical protein
VASASPSGLAGVAGVGKGSKGAIPTTKSNPDLWASNGKYEHCTATARLCVTILKDGALPGEPRWPTLRKPVYRPTDFLALTEPSGVRFLLFSAISFVS